MAKKTVKALINGGKATAAPPLGPALGPLGVNIGQVISEINKKTAIFQGMQVPVTVTVDEKTKEFEIEIGTPPASALILKEAGIEKGSANPKDDKIADIKIEQVIKVAKMKEGNLLGKTMKEKVKEIMGTCNSMGVLVEGKPATEAIKEVNSGLYDKEIKEQKTELTAAEMKSLAEEKKRLTEEIEKRRTEFMARGKQILEEFKGQPNSTIKSKMIEAKIPKVIMEELLPSEKKDAAGTPGAAPAAGGAGAAAAKPAKK